MDGRPAHVADQFRGGVAGAHCDGLDLTITGCCQLGEQQAPLPDTITHRFERLAAAVGPAGIDLHVTCWAEHVASPWWLPCQACASGFRRLSLGPPPDKTHQHRLPAPGPSHCGLPRLTSRLDGGLLRDFVHNSVHKRQQEGLSGNRKRPLTCEIGSGGRDLNLRPLGYEHYDTHLRCLGRSLPDALTSEARGLPVSRGQTLDLRFSAGLSSPRSVPVMVQCRRPSRSDSGGPKMNRSLSPSVSEFPVPPAVSLLPALPNRRSRVVRHKRHVKDP